MREAITSISLVELVELPLLEEKHGVPAVLDVSVGDLCRAYLLDGPVLPLKWREPVEGRGRDQQRGAVELSLALASAIAILCRNQGAGQDRAGRAGAV